MQIENLTQTFDRQETLLYLNTYNKATISSYNTFHSYLKQNVLSLSNQNISYILENVDNKIIKHLITMWFYEFNDICLDNNLHHFAWYAIPQILPNKSILNTNIFWIKFEHYINSDRCDRNTTN